MENIIKKYREKMNLTKEELGNLLGVSGSYCSRIESGKTTISVKLMKKLIEKLGISEEDAKILKQEQAINKTPDFYAEELEELKNKIELTKLSEKKIRLKKYGIASAGSGKMNFCDLEDDIEVYDNGFSKKAFAIQVEGDSMEPEIKDGSIVIVEPEKTSWDEIKDKIAVIRYNDEIYVKRIRLNNDGRVILLESINPKYNNITILSEDIENFKCYGKVVGVEYRKYYR